MKKKIRLILALFLINAVFFISLSTLSAQDSLIINALDSAWLGTFEGELEIFSVKGVTQEIEMKLIHESIPGENILRWAIQYGNGSDAIRDYSLQLADAESGHFLIDEHNSILIDQYLFGNKFLSWYEVAGSLILVSYTLVEDVIIFEVIAGSSDPVRTTGGELVDDEEIPEVHGYPITVYQKAMLKKVVEN
jgi:hypothetical protein